MNAEISKSEQRIVGIPFKKGKSPNPGGMPRKVAELVTLARTDCEAAIKMAIEFRKNKALEPVVRLKCAEFVCNYGMGKPRQLKREDTEFDASRMSKKELLASLMDDNEFMADIREELTRRGDSMGGVQ